MKLSQLRSRLFSGARDAVQADINNWTRGVAVSTTTASAAAGEVKDQTFVSAEVSSDGTGIQVAIFYTE
jgi:hypothetical protein